uniref:t-SNARE coiled-coil homology domain-containing protein n=1 Tax=Rhabditophanes sp. KR3021 TaxID=114890 RepID=A0AC35UEY4_9BILA
MVAYNRPRSNGDRSDHFLQEQNDTLTEQLSSKISKLKQIAVDIGAEAKDQNRLLGTMQTDFWNANESLGQNMKRIGGVIKAGGSKLILYLVLFSLFCCFVMYCLYKR